MRPPFCAPPHAATQSSGVQRAISRLSKYSAESGVFTGARLQIAAPPGAQWTQPSGSERFLVRGGGGLVLRLDLVVRRERRGVTRSVIAAALLAFESGVMAAGRLTKGVLLAVGDLDTLRLDDGLKRPGEEERRAAELGEQRQRRGHQPLRGGVQLHVLVRVEVREELDSILVALGSGALEPVSGFAEVDFRACSVPVTRAKARLSTG